MAGCKDTETGKGAPAEAAQTGDTKKPGLASPREGVFFSREHGFSMRFPEGWIVKEDRGLPWGITAKPPLASVIASETRNVNVIVNHVPDDMTLERLYQLSRTELKRAFPDMVFLDEFDGEMGGAKALCMVSKQRYADMDITMLKCAALNGGRVYIVSCTALESEFDRHRPEFEKIMDSIKLY